MSHSSTICNVGLDGGPSASSFPTSSSGDETIPTSSFSFPSQGSSGNFSKMYSYRSFISPVLSSKRGLPPMYTVSSGSPNSFSDWEMSHSSTICNVGLDGGPSASSFPTSSFSSQGSSGNFSKMYSYRSFIPPVTGSKRGLP